MIGGTECRWGALRPLEALADDLVRLHGPDDRALRTVRETLDRMR
ncbi:hypothetical protein [Actinomadura physcomitrii]|nr:hypothetical protein [Actinomadura physcomitrii]